MHEDLMCYSRLSQLLGNLFAVIRDYASMRKYRLTISYCMLRGQKVEWTQVLPLTGVKTGIKPKLIDRYRNFVQKLLSLGCMSLFGEWILTNEHKRASISFLVAFHLLCVRSTSHILLATIMATLYLYKELSY